MSPSYEEPLYRPPSEAGSLIFQATLGCSHNRCSFCYMYKDKRFAPRPREELLAEIDEAGREYPDTRRVFLADGDAFVLSTERLEEILDRLGASFPLLQRVSCYATPRNLLEKTVEQMRLLRGKKLSLLYYGVETGDPELLERIDKGATPDEMAEGCARAHEAGLKLSVTMVLGLGGREGSMRHARLTAALLGRIRPRYLSALSLMRAPGFDGHAESMGPGFEPNTPLDDVRELRALVEALETDRCIFRSNHASNHLALAGTLMKDKGAILRTIDEALVRPDRFLRPEWMRGL